MYMINIIQNSMNCSHSCAAGAVPVVNRLRRTALFMRRRQ
jgi:hypothetical protein